MCCVACIFVSCQICSLEQAGWEQKYKCPKTARISAQYPPAPVNRANSSLPKHEHNQKFEHILSCLRELEQGVLDTAKSNEQYATALDSQEVKVSQMKPELDAASQKNAVLQGQLDVALESMRRITQESSSHNTARSDILVQLQDALLREADLRDSTERLSKERDTLRNKGRDSNSRKAELEAKCTR